MVRFDLTGSWPEVRKIKVVTSSQKNWLLKSFNNNILVYTNSFVTFFFVQRDTKLHNSNTIRNITDIIMWLTNWIIRIVTVTFEWYLTVSTVQTQDTGNFLVGNTYCSSSGHICGRGLMWTGRGLWNHDYPRLDQLYQISIHGGTERHLAVTSKCG